MRKKVLSPRFFAVLIVMMVSTLLFFRHGENFRVGSKVPGDFQVYHKAASRVHNGVNPYIPSEGSPYKYSPAALIPFRLLPSQENLAWFVFKFLSLMALGVSILKGHAFSRWIDLGYLGVGLILCWKGLLETLDYGQIEFFALLFTVLAAHGFEKNTRISGFVLGCLPWLKLPWAFLMIPFALAARRRGQGKVLSLALGYLSGFIGFGMISPVLVFGFRRTLLYMHSWIDLLAQQRRELYIGDMNQSLWSTGARWAEGAGFAGFGLAILLGVSCLFLFLKLALKNFSVRALAFEQPLADISPWLILMQLINPLSWRWGSLFLVGSPFTVERKFESQFEVQSQSGSPQFQSGSQSQPQPQTKRNLYLATLLGAAVLVLWMLQM